MDEERVVEQNVQPPCDIEAEKAVLGSMMKDADAAADAIDKLKFDDFYLKEHQELYQAIIELHRKNIAIDITTTYSALCERKTQELVGGMTYLGKLVNDAIVPSNAKYYADTVVAKSRMRSLIHEADMIRSRAFEAEADDEEILDFAEQRIFEIAQRSQKRNYEDINDVLVENIKQIRELEQNKGQLPGITTGFRDLDKKLNGLHKSDLIILAARPGMGKTSFALNIAQNAAMDGNSVMIFSMEMSATQLGQRMLAMSACVDMENLKTGNLSSDDWMALSDAQDSYENCTLYIDDTSDLSVMEMKNKCRRLKAEKGLDLIIVDYLQLMNMGYKTDNLVAAIGQITRNLKVMAKELDVAIILLSQLSRASEQRANHRPQLSDLRDSGSIEQDADIVIFLRRDDYYENDEEAAQINAGANLTCDVDIAKHRSGPTGIIKLAWIGRYTKFGNLAHSFEGDNF